MTLVRGEEQDVYIISDEDGGDIQIVGGEQIIMGSNENMQSPSSPDFNYTGQHIQGLHEGLNVDISSPLMNPSKRDSSSQEVVTSKETTQQFIHVQPV